MPEFVADAVADDVRTLVASPISRREESPMFARFVPSLFMVLASIGCASVDIRRLNSDEKDVDSRGLRFQRPAPFLIVTLKPDSGDDGPAPNAAGAKPDGQKAESGTPTSRFRDADVKIVMLPDPKETYSITWSPGLFGSVNPDLTLTDGWNLTAFAADIDSKGADVLSTLLDVLPKKQDLGATLKANVLIYRLVRDDSSDLGVKAVGPLLIDLPDGHK